MTKEELRGYLATKRERAQIQRRIEQTQDKIEEIEGRLYAPKAQQLTGMPAAPSRKGSALEDIVAGCEEELLDQRSRYQQLLEHYMELGAKLAAQQLAIEKAIEALEPIERTLLRCHYLEGMRWEDVCVQIGYSWRQTHRLHAEALKKLKEKEAQRND